MKREVKYWGASDYHFDHNNVLKYDSRPFKTIHEMNEEIIDRHNSLVHPEDIFYYLGDFCFNNKTAESYMKRLNGIKYFIKGNHDGKQIVDLYKKYGTYLGEQASYIKIGSTKTVLNHFRMMVWDKCHYGSVHFYAHSHGNLASYDQGRSQDLFIGNYNYYPANLEDEVERLLLKPIVSVDGHRIK